jgi:hypothetical protein
MLFQFPHTNIVLTARIGKSGTLMVLCGRCTMADQTIVMNPNLLEIARLLLEFTLELQNSRNNECEKFREAARESSKHLRKERSSR